MSSKPGKKIDVINIEGRLSHHKVELRLDRSRGTFHAKIGETWYSNKDVRALEKTLTEAVIALDVELARGGLIKGCDLIFHVSEVSAPIADSEACERQTRLVREVRENEEGVLVADGDPHRQHRWWNETKTIPYTPERYAKLVHMSKQLTVLYRELLSIFAGESATVAALLDSATKTLLLGAGK